jgi:hypothetical protein
MNFDGINVPGGDGMPVSPGSGSGAVLRVSRDGQVSTERHPDALGRLHPKDPQAWELYGFTIVPMKPWTLDKPGEPIRKWLTKEFVGDWTLFTSDEEGKRATVWDFLRARNLCVPGIELDGSGHCAIVKRERFPAVLEGLDPGRPAKWAADLDGWNAERYASALSNERQHTELIFEVNLYRLPEGARGLKSCDLSPTVRFTVDDVLPVPGTAGPHGKELLWRSPTPWHRDLVDFGGALNFNRKTRVYEQTPPKFGAAHSERMALPAELVSLLKKRKQP